MASTDEMGSGTKLTKQTYKERLYQLQVQLVRLQRHLIETDGKVLVILEGRDAAGKDGAIKRVVQHLSPRESRVVALGRPTDRDRTTWYFQRWVAHLPAAQEMVLFNRSWYNRAGVERVMGFCTEHDYAAFMGSVCPFERMLAESGIQLFKYYLDIRRKTQKHRLAARRQNPLKQWKVSPIDDQALAHWDDYSRARNEMLARTDHPAAPWYVVRADRKRPARLALIHNLLARQDYQGKDEALLARLASDAVFPYERVFEQPELLAP